MFTSTAPAKRTLSEFKTAMILGLNHCELWRMCLQFMPKVLQNEGEIKAVLDHQLDEMQRTGQVPMKVNAMPGLVSDESDIKESYEDLHAMQPKNSCYNCKGTVLKLGV